MQETFSFYKPEERPAVEWPRAGMSPEWLRVPSLKEIDESLIKYNECCTAVDNARDYCATIKSFCGYSVNVEIPDNEKLNKIYLNHVLSADGPLFNLPLYVRQLGSICKPYGRNKEEFAAIIEGGVIEFLNDDEPYLVKEPGAGPREYRRITARDVRDIAEQLCKCERGIMRYYCKDALRGFFKNYQENRPIRTREHYGTRGYISNDYTYAAARNARTILAFLRYVTHGDGLYNNVKGGEEWKNEFFTATFQKNGSACLSLSSEAVAIFERMRQEYYMVNIDNN